MVGPLQNRLLRMMEHGRGTTAAELHKALIEQDGVKSKSYSTVLSVLRNLAKRRPDLLGSEKVKQQLVFTLKIPVQVIYAGEFATFINGMGWDGKSTAFLRATAEMPNISSTLRMALRQEIADLEVNT